MTKFEIPEVSIKEVLKRYESIKPIVRDEMYTPYYTRNLKNYEVTSMNFLKIENIYGNKADLSSLKVLKEITMLHKYGYYGFFKPSVGEVLKQIPKDLVDKVTCFEIVSQLPMNEHVDALNAGFHVSLVKLYSELSA